LHETSQQVPPQVIRSEPVLSRWAFVLSLQFLMREGMIDGGGHLAIQGAIIYAPNMLINGWSKYRYYDKKHDDDEACHGSLIA
jgi:hypothetical protein